MTAYTHVGMVANFAGGAVSQSVFSFDSPLSRIMFEVTGTEGTLSIPDPNMLTGPVRITRPATMDTMHDEPEWISVPVADETFSRGAGGARPSHATSETAARRWPRDHSATACST